MPVDLETFYSRYGPMVLRRCRRLLGNEEAALDAMQDVFVQVLRHQDRLEDRGASSLLFRIATNTCLNRIRSQGRRPEVADGELLDLIARSTDDDPRKEARSLLSRLFQEVPESTATIATLHLLDGMTLEEVAGEVGMSVSGVRKRLRGLKAIAREVEMREGAQA
ncbi:MAG: sigma-70 family RNA polymerase sigma factor [Deltaproteobacteria bacterium]|nr:sigma-70 family RNA polymerase sigma factor [Deltaproteobacteria bacterium]